MSITIQTINNTGVINFRNSEVKVHSVQDPTHTFPGVQEQGVLADDVKKINQTIGDIKQQVNDYKASLSQWMEDEQKSVQSVWTQKRMPGLARYMEQLSQWTHMSVSTIIYDSEVSPLTTESLFSSVNGKSNVMLIVTTDGDNIFGSFHGELPNSISRWKEADPMHFVFTLQNPYGIPPTKFSPLKPDCYPIWFYKSPTAIYCIQYFCHISNNKQCFINTKEWSGKGFSEVYNDTTGKDGRVFTKTLYPSRFGIKRLVAVQWK